MSALHLSDEQGRHPVRVSRRSGPSELAWSAGGTPGPEPPAGSVSEGDARDHDDARHSAQTRRAIAAGRRQLAGRSGTLTCVLCRAGCRPPGARTPAANWRGPHHPATRGFNTPPAPEAERGHYRLSPPGTPAPPGRPPWTRGPPPERL